MLHTKSNFRRKSIFDINSAQGEYKEESQTDNLLKLSFYKPNLVRSSPGTALSSHFFIPGSTAQTAYLLAHHIWTVTPLYNLLESANSSSKS
jgi:hypothetical protein